MFVQSPQRHLNDLLKQLDIPHSVDEVEQLVASVSAGSVGKGKELLSADALKRIVPLVSETIANVSATWHPSLPAVNNFQAA